MSSFNGISFRIIPEGSDFPQFVRESSDPFAYMATFDVLIFGRTNLNSLLQLVTIETHKRPRGTTALVVHIEAGNPSPKALVYPKQAGTMKTMNALLTKVDGVKVYAKPAGGGITGNETYKASLTFLATGDPDS